VSIGLDFLEISESSRYDTTIDPGTSQSAFAVPSSANTHTLIRELFLGVLRLKKNSRMILNISQVRIYEK
jgi:hypothetical protein